ncbi:coiled-coil domain-containing protein 150-like isoform X3 [Mizuhopecten yessoensis]|uniref:coiled-coil domain-containing protein 150-like isoform X3 n=1 Tax=Mizuhopecten yessoensis TaxID=6573 RepID=UPI000B45A20D|nr:coiled-coil domain-containing protein 150-like isoform X3 [Mizuhopecten yessoensis]
MMSRSVIPPSACPSGVSSHQTIDVLEDRLSAAELETRELIDHLSGMGFGQNVHPAERDTDSQDIKMKEPIAPYKARIADVDILHDSYETLVSRVCKTESAIQTLKLNLINIQGQQDLHPKLHDQTEDKYQMLKEACENELGKLQRETEDLQEELKQETDAKNRAHEEVKELRLALEEATTTRAEAAVSAEEMLTGKQKMQRKMSDIKEDLEREKSIRCSLEESHNTLLGRVREMESIVESERNEVKSLATDCTNLRNDALRVREELRQEQSRVEMAENGFVQTMEELERVKKLHSSAESDRELLVTELSRLRTQYEDLIKQLEQTQVIVDQQKEMLLIDKITIGNHFNQIKSGNKELAEKTEHLNTIVRTHQEEKDRLRTMHAKELNAERSRLAEKQAVEDEALEYKLKFNDADSQNQVQKKKIVALEKELASVTKKTKDRDEEYNDAADRLQKELNSLQLQLEVLQKEKDRATKDKENLLEEVNQTVDGMVEERSNLQGEVQQARLEMEATSRSKRQLELENTTLLERINSYETHKAASTKIEDTMKDMMDQKNKLAYDNGRLQSQVSQLTAQLEVLSGSHTEVSQYRKLNQDLQKKYDKAQKEISDLKVRVHAQESQLMMSQGSLESRDRDFLELRVARDQAIREKERLLNQLHDLDQRDKPKVEGLQKNLHDAKTVNKEIGNTLEAVMSSHSQLQTVVEDLQVQLGKKDTQISQLKMSKNKKEEDWKMELRLFEERMENLREELRKEREKSHKKTSRDIAEIKKQNDNLQNRNMELVKTNTELRHRVTECDSTAKDLKEKVADQKRKNEYLHRSKRELEDNVDKVKEMRSEIEDLERLRDEYMKRNHDQGEMINTFMNQIACLQSELRNLAQAQSQTNSLINQREEALEKERVYKEDSRRKHKVHSGRPLETRRQKEEIERMRREAEEKLKMAQDESAEISIHLSDAHNWFKSKFNKLQDEILSSKKTQADLEEENRDQKMLLESEQYKSNQAAERAKEMIRASRNTISQLADYGDMADTEVREEMARLKREVQKQKDHAKYIEMKHEKYKEASSRQLGNLLKDFGR